MSIARVYSLNVSITSGARYHLRARQRRQPLSRAGRHAPRRDVFGQERAPVVLHVRRRLGGAREPEVAQLEVAVRVQEQVRRLQVPVQHVGRVQRLERPQRLSRP
jgi:hypothetical protein